MKIPRTIPLGLLLSLSMFGALFLLRWAPLGGMPLSVKCLLTPGLMALLSNKLDQDRSVEAGPPD